MYGTLKIVRHTRAVEGSRTMISRKALDGAFERNRYPYFPKSLKCSAFSLVVDVILIDFETFTSKGEQEQISYGHTLLCAPNTQLMHHILGDFC